MGWTALVPREVWFSKSSYTQEKIKSCTGFRKQNLDILNHEPYKFQSTESCSLWFHHKPYKKCNCKFKIFMWLTMHAVKTGLQFRLQTIPALKLTKRWQETKKSHVKLTPWRLDKKYTLLFQTDIWQKKYMPLIKVPYIKKRKKKLLQPLKERS